MRPLTTISLSVVASLLICGCSSSSTTSASSSPGKLQAEGNTEPANWGADQSGQNGFGSPVASNQPQSAKSGSGTVQNQTGPRLQRGALLAHRREDTPTKAVNPFVAQYGKARLDRAAAIHNWAHVSVVPVGIDAFIKTAWTDGFLRIRLALLGPKQNLEQFAREQADLKLTFQDRAGNPLYEFIIPIDQIKEAPPNVNGGTPTYAVEGSMEIPLELYEDFYQWMFEWE